MFRKLIFLISLVLVLGSSAHAGLYVWDGSAGDGIWDTALNWIVTDSAWTWPNEEFGDKNVNDDTLGIDILNGEAVSRGSQVSIQGAADGSTTGVLTLDNGSSLTVDGRLAIGGVDNTLGQIDILGGSSVTILGEGNDLRIVDNDGTWGTMNIIDSTVDIADDLSIDQGEGYVNIGGSSIVTAEDVWIADANTAVGYMDISGTATVTISDDFGVGDGGVGTVNISGDATLEVADELYIANNGGSKGELNISDNATVNVGDDLNVGDNGPGICNIGDNATVTVSDDVYVAHNVADGAFESHMTISGNATVSVDDFIVANNAGLTGYLHISGNPTISTVDDFIMNDDDSDPMVPSTSQVIMDGGTVNVGDSATFNDDNNGTAEFILNGGSFYCAGYLNLSDNLDGTAHLTINGGEMITGDRLRLGKDGGEDTGQVRIFMNGGLLQAEELSDIMITDTKIIYTGGEIRIRQPFQPDPVGDPNTWWGLSKADMQDLIDTGIIEVNDVYSIITIGDYTVLSPNPPIALGPSPADGATEVVESTLEWIAAHNAVSHRVYVSTDETIDESDFLAETDLTIQLAGLVPGTTYYWRVDEVDADGVVTEGNVWSFTTADYLVIDDSETILDYDNSVEPYTTEASWDTPADLTVSGITDLTFRFHGAPPSGNSAELMYVALEDGAGALGVVTHPNPAATQIDQWWNWKVPLLAFSDAGVDVADAAKLYIGVGDVNVDVNDVNNLIVGGTGSIRIDKIRVVPPIVILEQTDVTAPGDNVRGVPNNGNWPGAETPPLVVDDNSETKYLHFDGDFDPDPNAGPTGFKVTPLAGATIVTGLTFTTANDVPGRDPIAFELSGSNVGIDGPYKLIASGDIADFNEPNEWPRFTKNETPITFDNATVYKHYQVLFPAIRGPVGGSVNSMQIAEVELIGVTEDVLVDITSPGNTIYGHPTDVDWPSSESPLKALDNDIRTNYRHNKGEKQPTGFVVNPSKKKVVNRLTITTADDAPERDPVAFKFYGSDDHVYIGPWTLIASGTIDDFNQETPWPRMAKNETPIMFDNDVAYKHYRLMITEVRDPGSADSMQLAEVELIEALD